jgi:hypothetical protein
MATPIFPLFAAATRHSLSVFRLLEGGAQKKRIGFSKRSYHYRQLHSSTTNSPYLSDFKNQLPSLSDLLHMTSANLIRQPGAELSEEACQFLFSTFRLMAI